MSSINRALMQKHIVAAIIISYDTFLRLLNLIHAGARRDEIDEFFQQHQVSYILPVWAWRVNVLLHK